jgi:uncharacterized protein YkwD
MKNKKYLSLICALILGGSVVMPVVAVNHSAYEQQMLEFVNRERKNANLKPLEIMDSLTEAAKYCLEERIKYPNTSKMDLFSILQKSGVGKCSQVSENFAKGYSSPYEIVRDWLGSRSQKEDILDPDATHMALAYSDTTSKYWCQLIVHKVQNIDNQTLEQYRLQVINLVNEERKKYNLEPLTGLEPLMNDAQIRAVEQAKKVGHTRPDGTAWSTVIDKSKLNLGDSYRFGENVAMGQRTPKEVVDGWMNSPAHRENILTPEFKYIGVGAHYENETTYWAQLFYGN